MRFKKKFLTVISFLLTFILIGVNINIPVSADWNLRSAFNRGTSSITDLTDSSESTYDLTLKVGPGNVNLHLYPTTGYDETGYDTYNVNEEITLGNGETLTDTNGSYKVYTIADLPAGTYSYRGVDTAGNSLGGMTFDIPANGTVGSNPNEITVELRQQEFYVGTKLDDVNYATADQYQVAATDAGGKHVTIGDSYVDANGYTRYRSLFYAGGNAELYTYFINPKGKYTDAYGERMLINKTVLSGSYISSIYTSLAALLDYSITSPADAKVQIFNQIKNFWASEIEPKSTTTNNDGTQTAHYRLAAGGSNYTYRVSKTDKITKAGYLPLSSGGNTTVTFEEDENPQVRPVYDRSTTLGSRMEDSVVLNVNADNFLTLSEGETFRLRAYRAGWEIINSDVSNIMIEPDFHYEILSGSDIISITPVTSGNGNATNNWLDIKGLKNGTAIVKVTYDAIDIGGNTKYKGIYGASDPQRYGLVAIHVGDDCADIDWNIEKIGQTDWDSEFDTAYFLEDTGVINFKPSAKDGTITSVKMNDEQLTKQNDGTYSAAVKPGANLLEVQAGNQIAYKTIRGAKVNYTIEKEGDSDVAAYQVGDTIKITFNGLYIPVPKMSGLYNPGFGNTQKLTYSMSINNKEAPAVVGAGRQYDFITKHTITLTLNEAGTYRLTKGHLPMTMMGAADPMLTGHRSLPDTGIGANFSAVSTAWDFNTLPDITFQVVPKDEIDKSEQIEAVKAAFDAVIGKPYGKEKRERIISAKDTGLDAIANAETIEAVNIAKDAAIASIQEAAAVTFHVPGKIAGHVMVSLADNGIRTSKDVDYPDALGDIIPAVSVPFVEGESIAQVTVRLLDAYGIDYKYTGSPQNSFYLSAITDFYLADGTYIPSFGEFDSGSLSGWMISWNNWFINMGASEFQVEEGDIIRWQNTCQLGKDIGNDWSNQSAKITGILIDNGNRSITPGFTDGVKEYTLSLKSDVETIKVEALLENYWAQVTYRINDVYYKLLRDIPVEDGTVITIESAISQYAGGEPADKDCITITIDKELTPEQELAKAKTEAGKELEAYKDPADYRTEQQSELARVITKAKNDIALAESVEAVHSILKKAKGKIDRLKTDAELTEEENTDLSALLEQYIHGAIQGRKTNDALTGTSILGSEQFTDEDNGGNYAASSTWSDWLAMMMGRYSIVKSDGTIDFKYDDKTGYNDYLKALERYVTKTYAANDGKLHRVKATEWQRLIITVSALGGDPTNFGTYNGKPINLVADGTYNCVIKGGPSRQGINGIIFALISKNMYPNEQPEEVLYSDSYFIQYLLERQLTDGTDGAYGGWALTGANSDPDITAMAIQALAPYYKSDVVYTYVNKKTNESVSKTIKQAVEEALNKLSAMQESDGDYKSWGSTNVESTAQVLTALCELGIDPSKDQRFITAAGNTLLDGILKYRLKDGSFCHTFIQDADNPSAEAGEYNYMATDQAGYALVAYWRFINGMSSLYNMTADETVPDIVLGDADGNGKVELQDAQIVLKSALKILILPEERRQSADVNKNGSIDLEDANIVLKMALRII